jgi:hypothetical protein
MSPWFFQRKEDGGDRRVEGGGQGAGGPDRHEILEPLRRDAQRPSDERREARADLDRRPLPSHRMAGADGQHAGQELAERHPRGDVAAVQVKSGFGLRDAAAAHIREHPREQHAGDKADHGRHEKQASR